MALWPEHPEAYRYLAYIMIRQQAYLEALSYLRQASALKPGDPLLQWELEQVQALAGELPDAGLAHNPDGKLRFRERYQRTHHRSGWRYAVNALYQLHNDTGVRFEDFLEDPFAWQHRHNGIRSGAEILRAILSQDHDAPINAQEKGIIPIVEPWAGILHNPPAMPAFFHPAESPRAVVAKAVWRESMEACIGLFTLSEYCSQWLREATGKPVSTLVHPTEIPDTLFDFDAFDHNESKKIVQVGWWLRRLGAIYELPLAAGNAMGYTKVRLVPQFIEQADQYLNNLIATQLRERPVPPTAARDNTREFGHLSDAAYDSLLSCNIVFIQLYDASANNTVIECIARGTPVLVNPLPAVLEYLGLDYPLYYDSLEQAAAMALDPHRLAVAHTHLMENPLRKLLGADAFRQQMLESEVYGLL
ncbi:MAG: tetratricopeptide repeat protein [Haliea sp.]|nr:tetratricopeptide repeat protein [Haliea sp.]